MIVTRILAPSRSENYRAVRRGSLNFEICGGERHSPDDTPPQSLGPIYRFLAAAARRGDQVRSR